MTPSEDPKRLREEKMRTNPPSLKTGLQCKHCLRNDCQSSPKQSMSEEYALRSVGTALSKYWSSNAKEVLKAVILTLSHQKQTPLLRWWLPLLKILEQQSTGGSERSNTYSQPPGAYTIVEMVTATVTAWGSV